MVRPDPLDGFGRQGRGLGMKGMGRGEEREEWRGR